MPPAKTKAPKRPVVPEYVGTPLTSEDFAQGRVCTTTGAPHAHFAWDTGVAIGRYLAELKEGRLIGKRCDSCHRVMIPPRMFCELCWKPTAEWVHLKDTGTVNTFSICYITWDMKKLEVPQIPAVVEIDGATRMQAILHLLGDVDPKKVHIGMKVKAVWKPAEERTGAITDIRYFRPL